MKTIHKIMLMLTKIFLLAIMLITGISVVARYLLNQPIPWSDQVIGYLLCFMVMFSAADLILKERNIYIDILVKHLGRKWQALPGMISLSSVFIVSLLVLFSGIHLVWFVYDFGLYESGYLLLPGWIPRLCIPIGGAAMLPAVFIRCRDIRVKQAGAKSGK